MTSEQRREARRRRREKKRALRKAARLEDCTLDAIVDLNSLHKAARGSARGVTWKSSIQRYLKNELRYIVKTRRDLLAGNYIHQGFAYFDVYERGKLRHIASVHPLERIPQKSLTQNALIPAIVPSLVQANTANIKGRGTDFALRIIKRDLIRHWRMHKSAGYILLMDFSDYFARIAHAPLKAQLTDALHDKRVIDLVYQIIDTQGHTGLGLGSEPNQICAVAFPNRIDHYAVEMLGVRAYGRYMDDSYFIHEDKAYLGVIRQLIERKCDELGIVVNPKKTRIVKLTKGFTFLKKRFSYSPSGHIVVRPCREAITRERRKLKKQHKMVVRGTMTPEQVSKSYQSWRGSMIRLDAHRTVLSMDALFRSLFH